MALKMEGKLLHADFLIQSNCNRVTKAAKLRSRDRSNSRLPTRWYAGTVVWQSERKGTQE